MKLPPHPHADNVMSIQVPVAVTLSSKKITLGDALNLVPGAVLTFEDRCDGSLRVDAAGKKVGTGSAVKIGERLGVKIGS